MICISSQRESIGTRKGKIKKSQFIPIKQKRAAIVSPLALHEQTEVEERKVRKG